MNISIIFILLLLLLFFKNNIYENLEIPSTSSAGDVSSGASEMYGWGYTPIKVKKPVSRKCPSCENIFIDEIDNCNTCKQKDCRYADITQNIDIDKYVLKSSVPPCPNMSEYAKKYQIPPYPFNKNEWIRKSEIPHCKNPDMNEYIKKSEVPSKSCPSCPSCPICPDSRKIWNPKFWKPNFIELNEG